MHDLGIQLQHRGRDNVGGVVIHDGVFEFIEEDACAAMIVDQVIELSGLGCDPPLTGDLRTQALTNVKEWLTAWNEADSHHKRDPQAPSNGPASAANTGIAARIFNPSMGW
jgi:hypothetical protein